CVFDRHGTPVHDPRPKDRLARALAIVGRAVAPHEIDALETELARSAAHPGIVEAMIGEDTSAARHRAANMLWFAHAGLDADLAEALYGFDADPDNRPLYPDAIATLAALKAADVMVAVVSDIHLDIRV